ncbi:MAG TPA: DUF1840 domain-containing protein [Burkholderiales bacterium]|nr:DUF1840 domain-containing protein [Burkholderiales bacterium]
MLVRFQSPAHASITMFGDLAKTLLKAMGASGDIPGALQAEDVPAALQRLREGISTLPPVKSEADSRQDDDSPRVSPSTRAYPLIQLLEAAAKKKQYVMWEERPADSPSPD